MSGIVHIALAANHRYVEGLRATLASMINACSQKERLRFHVFSDGLTEEDKSGLVALAERFGYVDPIDFREPDMKPIADRFSAYYGTHTAYIRLFFPETMPELEWVLWSDVDTLWFKDPIALWEERDSSASVVWVEDLPSTRRFVSEWHSIADPLFDNKRYCCSGVMLMNLARLRAKNFVKQGMSLVSRYGTPPFADQGLFNALCGDDSKVVDGTWDLLRPTRHVNGGVVLHFNGLGKMFSDPGYSGWRPLYEIWFRYREQVVVGASDAQVWPVGKRILMRMLGCLYPVWWMSYLIPMRFWYRDNIRRTLFFAWLRGRKLW